MSLKVVLLVLLLVEALAVSEAAFRCSGSLSARYTNARYRVRVSSAPFNTPATGSKWAGSRTMPGDMCAGSHTVDGSAICCAGSKIPAPTQLCWNMNTTDIFVRPLPHPANYYTLVSMIGAHNHFIYTTNETVPPRLVAVEAPLFETGPFALNASHVESVVWTDLKMFQSAQHSFIFAGHSAGLYQGIWEAHTPMDFANNFSLVPGVDSVSSLAIVGNFLYIQTLEGDSSLIRLTIDPLASQLPVLLPQAPETGFQIYMNASFYQLPKIISSPNCPGALLAQSTIMGSAGLPVSAFYYVDPTNASAPQNALAVQTLLFSVQMSSVMPDFLPVGTPSCPLPSPSPNELFYCNYTTLVWTLKDDFFGTNFIGTGNISVIGDLNITTSATLLGMSTTLKVAGCIFLGDPTLNISLSHSDLLLLEASPTKSISTVLLTHVCENSFGTNLSSLAIVSQSSGCKQIIVTPLPESDSHSLSATFTLQDSCTSPAISKKIISSKTWWIILASVLAGVFLSVVIGSIIVWNVQARKHKLKLHHAKLNKPNTSA